MTGLLTMAEAAELLGCSERSLRRRVAAGELPIFRDGRIVRVRGADLERYVLERTARRQLVTATAVAPAGRTIPAGRRLWE